MCASSASEIRGCFCGLVYDANQAMIQINPSAPVAMKAHCQPYVTVIHGTTSGATTAPIFVPELKMPVASARSFFGNHSATALMDAGKLPDSPKPRANRATPKPNTEWASACAIAAKLQNNTESENPLRVPSRSITL